MKKKYDPQLIQEDLKKLIQQTLKEALEAELEDFLGYSKYDRGEKDNYRNGYISKTVKTAVGEIEIETPRDRNGEFGDLPQKLCNYSTTSSTSNLMFIS
jgi:transposase-like protein